MTERWRIKKGDVVVVISGKDKSKRGAVLSVHRNDRKVTVQGVNLVKKHVKPTMQSPGSIKVQERPLHVCKVMLLDPSIDKPVRAGVRFQDGVKVRFSRKTGQLI